jgi:hypothetical protein
MNEAMATQESAKDNLELIGDLTVHAVRCCKAVGAAMAEHHAVMDAWRESDQGAYLAWYKETGAEWPPQCVATWAALNVAKENLGRACVAMHAGEQIR